MALLDSQTLRAIAEREVREQQIDRAVRDAVRLGRYDGCANWERDFPTSRGFVHIHATSGAGTNSARVSVKTAAGTVTVYEASDYGRCLRTWRRGWWTAVVLSEANKVRDMEAAERLCADVEQEAEQAQRFTPLD